MQASFALFFQPVFRLLMTRRQYFQRIHAPAFVLPDHQRLLPGIFCNVFLICRQRKFCSPNMSGGCGLLCYLGSAPRTHDSAQSLHMLFAALLQPDDLRAGIQPANVCTFDQPRFGLGLTFRQVEHDLQWKRARQDFILNGFILDGSILKATPPSIRCATVPD